MCLIDITFNELRYFLFKFRIEKEKNDTLSMETLILKNSVRVFQSWKESMNFSHSHFESVSSYAWINLSHISIIYKDRQRLSLIVSVIGEAICFEQQN